MASHYISLYERVGQPKPDVLAQQGPTRALSRVVEFRDQFFGDLGGRSARGIAAQSDEIDWVQMTVYWMVEPRDRQPVSRGGKDGYRGLTRPWRVWPVSVARRLWLPHGRTPQHDLSVMTNIFKSEMRST